MQQLLSLVLPKPRDAKSRKVIRSLRKVRRDLSTCRNLDVILNLLHAKIDSSVSSEIANAWQDLQEHTSKLRKKEFARTHKRLRRVDILDVIEKTQRLLNGSKRELLPDFAPSINQSLAEWRASYTKATIDRSPDTLHKLRLAGKRLRYRLELLAEVKSTGLKPHIESLKALQDLLGRWHDRHVLIEFAKEFIDQSANDDGHEECYRGLQAALETEKRENQAAIESILEQAESFRIRATTLERALQT